MGALIARSFSAFFIPGDTAMGVPPRHARGRARNRRRARRTQPSPPAAIATSRCSFVAYGAGVAPLPGGRRGMAVASRFATSGDEGFDMQRAGMATLAALAVFAFGAGRSRYGGSGAPSVRAAGSVAMSRAFALPRVRSATRARRTFGNRSRATRSLRR